ncbi:MAG: hypothetical protein R6V67_07175 [Spirochaetia bacterium]
MKKADREYNIFPAAGTLRRTLRFFSPIIIFLIVMFLLLMCVTNPLAADEGNDFSGAASGDAVEKAEEILLQGGYSAGEAEAVLETLREAEAVEIPGEVLLSRVQEGVAKGAAAGRLAAALEQDIRTFREVRSFLEEVEGGDNIVESREQWQRAANMYTAGIEKEHIQSLAYICRERPEAFRRSTLLYVSITKWGLSKEKSQDVVAALVESSLPIDEYEGILELYRRAQRQRIKPEVLTERIVSQVKNAGSIEQLEKRILQ